MEKSEKHFVLVHGACHGAWCWYKVATLLRSEGHRVTALDMASSGIHPKRLDEVHSISDYFEPLMEFMAALPPEDKVVLVAHSMGGLSVAVAMEKFPEKIAVAGFVTALMPGPDLDLLAISQEYNRGLDSYMDTQYGYDRGPDQPPTSILFGPNFLSSKMYQLSPPQDSTLATLLVRPHPLFNKEETFIKETEVTKEKYGAVRRVYIVCDQDQVIKEDLQRWMIRNNPTDDVKVIFGSDHMVMFSKPQELFSCLQAIAEQYD